MKIPIIAANWKMNKTLGEMKEFLETFIPLVEKYSGNTEIVLAPPFTLIKSTIEEIEAAGLFNKISIAAQNLHWEEDGAYTGEISARMLSDLDCSYVIIGHSERRQFFGEKDDTVNLKITAALKEGLKPILCIGETKEQREAGDTFHVIESQLKGALNGFEAEDISDIVIAYEPVWAIGTGLTATPQQAQEVHNFIRSELKKLFGSSTSAAIRIQYGGSVKPGNIKSLMAEADIDGALVGGASLDASSFFDIISFDI